MVEFCPKCGSLLFPSKTDEGVILTCRRCGYKKALGKQLSYREVQIVSDEKKPRTSVLETTSEVSRERREKEKELLQEYYEVFLEEMAQEEASIEED